MRACETMEDEGPAPGERSVFALRKAQDDDVPQLIRLHRLAMRELGRSAYTADQIDSFLMHVPTFDDELIADHTYFVAESRGTIVGAGGWSIRVPAYQAAIDLGNADMGTDGSAMIRAMYTHPDWTRRGIGKSILEAAEAEAQRAGFRRIELHALLPGVPLYRACGYTSIGRWRARLSDGVTLPIVHMHKRVETYPVCVRRPRSTAAGAWHRAA